jgi:hypothetical protein
MILKWLNFLVQSHLFLTISTFFFSIGLLNWNESSILFSVALSLAVFGVYNLNRLNKLKKNQLPTEIRLWYEKYSVVLHSSAFLCISISALIYFYVLIQMPFSLLMLGVTGLITVLYIFTIKQVNLRQIPGTKALWISMVWTIMAVVIPKLTQDSFSWLDLHYFILFYALTIPGDMRDMEFDNPKMKTIPQQIGNRKSKFLFYFLLVLFLMINNLVEDRSLIEIIPVFLFSLILFAKRFSLRYALMDVILLIFGISSLFEW